MHILDGQIQQLRHTMEVEGGSNDVPVSTTHVAFFQLGERQVVLKSPQVIAFNEGDPLIVAGAMKGGVFCARVGIHSVTGYTAGESAVSWFAVGVVVLCMTAFALAHFSFNGLGALLIVVSVVAALCGLGCLAYGWQTREAYALVRRLARQRGAR